MCLLIMTWYFFIFMVRFLYRHFRGDLYMKKLVRDKVPDIASDKATFEVLSNEDYRLSLRDKVTEEAKEVKKADTRANLVEELGDLEEVIRAILEDASITYEEMDSLRQAKINQKGKFSQKFVMIKPDEES